MYDIERINKMIDDIGRFFRELDEIGYNEKNISNNEKMHASAMLILGIMNRAVDLAGDIAVKNNISMPPLYSDCFPALAKGGLLDKKLATELEALIKQRNLFAHHYYDSDAKSVLKVKKNIYAVKDFIERVKKIVAKSVKNE